MTTRLHRRGAFTLLELIVVIGIIVLLLSLTAAAVFRLRASQMEKNTNTHLLKIHSALQQQYSAAIDRIKKETPPAGVIAMTKNPDGTTDMARAKAFHLRMRLRQEFPQKFEEVFNTPPPIPDPGGGTTGYVYAPKAVFQNALKSPNMVASGPPSAFPKTFPENPARPEEQSAALLVLILSQGQGGSTTTPESIAPTKLLDFAQSQGPPVSLPVFRDEWGTHIAFRRQADDDMTDVLGELNPQFPLAQYPVTQPLPKSLDPLDPDGRMLAWPGSALLAKTFLLWNNNPPNRPYVAGNQNPFDGRNRGPFVFSAGGNTRFYNANGSMETDLDNLYSYRLAQSGKGN